jgi:predicted amidohydrolase
VRKVKVAAIQPPIPPGSIFSTQTATILSSALDMVAEAGTGGADLILLPELVNVFGMEMQVAQAHAETHARALIEQVASLAAHYRTNIVLPVLEKRGAHFYNSSKIIDRQGVVMGCYDKTHLTGAEIEWYNMAAGQGYPVFDLDFGRIGVMTCYDGYFPEVARIYALEGVDILCYPSWQSGPSEIVMETQMRARSIDNFIFLVRSSFGYAPEVAWRPGMFFGRSCIIDRDGTMVADAGHHQGIAFATVDLDRPRLMDVLDDGGDVRNLKDLTFGDRRPDTYQRLIKG